MRLERIWALGKVKINRGRLSESVEYVLRLNKVEITADCWGRGSFDGEV